MDRLRPRYTWLLLAMLLLAFGLRVYHLDAQSFWSDEGLSLYRARLPLGEILSNVIVVPPGVPTRDTNPPLYFVEEGAIRLASGDSEYALRFVSVIMGVLLIPLLYVTGKRLYSTRVGLIAALLGTLSPFLVWYSQEARAYTQITTFSLASVYLLLRALDLPVPDQSRPTQRRGRLWLAWIGVTLAMLASHFNSFFVLPFEGLMIIAALFRSRRREALLVLGGLILLAIPLIAYAGSRAQGVLDPVFRFRPLESIAQETWSAFLVGAPHEIFQPLWAVLPGLILLAIGAAGGLISKPWRRSGSITLAYLVVPLLVFYAAMFVVAIYIGPRHIIFLLPPVYLLMAAGVALLWTRWRIVAAALLTVQVGLMVWWAMVQYTDGTYLKDDIRSAACTIAAEARPADVVVLNDAIGSFVFDYYYQRCGGVAPWTIIPVYPSLDVEAALSEFQQATEKADRVWYLTHPARAVSNFDDIDAWARGHLLRLGHERFPSLWLGSAYQLYTAHFPIFTALPVNAEAHDKLWPDDGLRLSGVDPIVIAPARDQAQVNLYWRLDRAAQRNFIFTARLVDRSGAEWGLFNGSAFDNWPAKKWPVDQFIQQSMTMALPHGLPAGDYALLLGVADRNTNQVIPVADGSTEVEVATVKVLP